VADLQLAIIDALAAGQARSLVELGVELGAPYDHLGPTISHLEDDGVIEAGDDRGQVVYRLAKSVLAESEALGTVTSS
jgi:predicted transcriptional regulator